MLSLNLKDAKLCAFPNVGYVQYNPSHHISSLYLLPGVGHGVNKPNLPLLNAELVRILPVVISIAWVVMKDLRVHTAVEAKWQNTSTVPRTSSITYLRWFITTPEGMPTSQPGGGMLAMREV